MPILRQLYDMYKSQGITISTGLNPSHFGNLPLAPFTWFINKTGNNLTNGLGISSLEIYFLETLFHRYTPKHLFVIGNSFGWSSVALCLLNPSGRVLAIDCESDDNTDYGLIVTNKIAQKYNLNLVAVRGRSPNDVAHLALQHKITPIDFVFIDGTHTPDQIIDDFNAIKKWATQNCIYLFHDVQRHHLHEAIKKIAAGNNLSTKLFLGTSSGMSIVYNGSLCPVINDDIAPFAIDPVVEQFMRDRARAYQYRHLARLSRGLRKRFGLSQQARPKS
jgi:predicted O-methyltransferase YrrM